MRCLILVVSLLMSTGCNEAPVSIGDAEKELNVDIPRAGPPLEPFTNEFQSSNASPTDLVIRWSASAEIITDVVEQLGGSITQFIPQLDIYVASFETRSPVELQAIRDLLREHGYDASIDLQAPIM